MDRRTTKRKRQNLVAKVIQPASIHRFWTTYWRNLVFVSISLQIIIILSTVLLLDFTGIVSILSTEVWVIGAGVFLALLLFNFLVLRIASRPLKHIVTALSRANGEESTLKQAHVNDSWIERAGMKPVMTFIHELGSGSGDKSDESVDTSSHAIKFDEALESSTTGIAFLDSKGRVLFNNQKVPTREEPNYTNVIDVQYYNEISLNEWIRRCEQKSVNAEKTWVRVASKPSGQADRKLYDMHATYKKGSQVPVVVLFIEKTQEYMPEENDLNFIAFAAHELRGPITVIRGYLDTLIDELEDDISGEQRELFDRLVVSSNRLSSYVNNILNSAKYDQRHLNLHLSETSALRIYGIISDDMALRAKAQRRVLTVDIPSDLPPVAADPASASEVFGNLIDNAIKYSNEGGSVEVRAVAHETFVEVSVEDHGIGMPPNVVGNLFHKFYRSHRSRETVAGTGIGLYISKAIVESHGGTMEARSVEGVGSTFSFTLPTYASVASKLKKDGGSNKTLINNHSGSWIKNHGAIRG
jgi:signal transduction histidine kinase